MKICFFNTGYLPSRGGVATYSFEWVTHAARMREVTEAQVLAFGNPEPRAEKNGKVRLRAARTRNFFVIGLMTGWYFLRFFSYDFFHATNLFPVGFWTVLWSKIFRKKTGLIFYGTDACSDRASRLVRALKRWTITQCDLPLTISHFTKQQVEKIYGLEKTLVKVIYTGCPESSLEGKQILNYDQSAGELRKKRKIDPQDFIVLSVAQLVRRKGLDILMRAVSEISDERVKLFIVGTGPEWGALQKLREELGCPQRIFLEGRVDSVIPYYSLAHVGVLNSYYIKEEGDFEGLGLVLLEAQKFGLPVIGTRSGGIPEAIDDGKSGFVIPERDAEALKEKILLLHADSQRYKNMSEHARKFSEQKFNWSLAMSAYLEFLKKIIA